MRRFFFLVLLVVIIVAGGVSIWGYANHKLESGAPDVIIATSITHVGVNTLIAGEIVDQESGLREAKISILQNHRQITLWEDDWSAGAVVKQGIISQHDINLSINAHELGLVQGPATLIIETRDNSWRRWMRGNLTVKEIPVQVVLAPPKVNLLSRNIYINRSGSGVVVYRVNQSASSSGVQLGDDFYPGYAPWPGQPDVRVSFFAFPDTLSRNSAVRLLAMDPAGNSANQPVPVRLRWREFKTDNINLSDNFLAQVAERFAAQAPVGSKSDLDVFLWVNNDLRQASHEKLKEITSKSEARQLWSGAFLRPMGKMMSDFVEKRFYSYQGKQVASSTHYGLDLADVANTPIKAAADGKVAYAGDLGVYGNTIVIDHGLNLFTLYAHMHSLEVRAGDSVTLGQRIGLSGSTGFSFGDHLHFSCLIGSTYVTPYEWWDSHWIADNVDLQYRQAGMASPQ